MKALEELKRVKMKLKDQSMTEDIRHNYIYHILFNNWKNRERVLRSLNELPHMKQFPRLDKVTFRLPEHLGISELKSVLGRQETGPGQWQFPDVEDVGKKGLDVDFLNIDRLNKVNTKRLHELAVCDRPSTPDLDAMDKKLFDFLDKESTLRVRPAAPMSGTDARNELLNQDILREYDTINVNPYSDPLRVYSENEKKLGKSKSQNRYSSLGPDFRLSDI